VFFSLIHRCHSISFTRAQGIPKYKIGFGRGERWESWGQIGLRGVGVTVSVTGGWGGGEQPSLAVMFVGGSEGGGREEGERGIWGWAGAVFVSGLR
jgi:hypothetical protein